MVSVHITLFIITILETIPYKDYGQFCIKLEHFAKGILKALYFRYL